MPPVWLPKLITLADYDGNWDKYLDGVYEVFRADFLGSGFQFNGKRVGLKRHPVEEGKKRPKLPS